MEARIVLLPGDGIGPEIVAAAEALLETVAGVFGHGFTFQRCALGGVAIDQFGTPMPEPTARACREADAVLLGAVGGPKWDDPQAKVRPEQGLLALRRELKVFANLSPARALPALAAASPLKPERLEGVDLLVVRELTGGIYFGAKTEEPDSASDLCSYTAAEITRVVRLAAELAQGRRGRLTLVDKANVLATSRLWRRVSSEIVTRDYPHLDFETLLVDAAAMFLVSEPSRFDVLVTENMFGDILTDEAAAVVGSLGMLPSASVGDSGPGLFEPIHGSAPDLVGSGRANPMATLLSAAMLLEWGLGLKEEAAAVNAAVEECVAATETTPDLGGALTTAQVTRAVTRRLCATVTT